MNHISTAVRPKPPQPPLLARLADRRILACVFAAAAILAAIPGSAAMAASSGPSAVARPTASKPLPRAFFGLGPASAKKIDGRLYFSYSATQGARLSDHVALVNFGATEVTVKVFVADAESNSKGTVGWLPEGKLNGGPAAWVSIQFPHNSATIHLAPHSKLILPITIVVPKNASPGDHEGAVIASLTSVIQSKNHAKVHFVQQVAVPVVARISGILRPQLSIVGMHVAYSDPLSPIATAPATVSFRVKNTGNELLGGWLNVSVDGLLGSSASKTHAVKVPTLLPGSSDAVTVKVPGVYPEFWETAAVTIQPLVLVGQFDQGLSNYAAHTGFLAIPWILLIVIILIVLGIVALVWRRRRRRRQRATAAVPNTRSAGQELVGEEKR
jgi:hypothetical protein